MERAARKLPIRMAHQAMTPRIGRARKVTSARKKTSKAAKKIRSASSIAGSRSAPATRAAATMPKAANARTWITVYPRTGPTAMETAPVGTVSRTRPCQRTAGVRSGVPWTRSNTRNQAATVAAPIRPATTPSRTMRASLLMAPFLPGLRSARLRRHRPAGVGLLLARPPEEHDRPRHHVPERPHHPHEDSRQLLVRPGSEWPERGSLGVEGVEQVLGQRDRGGHGHHRHGGDEQVEELSRRGRPRPLGQGTQE